MLMTSNNKPKGKTNLTKQNEKTPLPRQYFVEVGMMFLVFFVLSVFPKRDVKLADRSPRPPTFVIRVSMGRTAQKALTWFMNLQPKVDAESYIVVN